MSNSFNRLIAAVVADIEAAQNRPDPYVASAQGQANYWHQPVYVNRKAIKAQVVTTYKDSFWGDQDLLVEPVGPDDDDDEFDNPMRQQGTAHLDSQPQQGAISPARNSQSSRVGLGWSPTTNGTRRW